MTFWNHWLDVQNAADLRGCETYEQQQPFRFITTPRDLATYVHYDALYEAYLNACLALLAMGAPFDRGIPFGAVDVQDKQQGFVQFGGPHILTLVCEVATRALKAVRYQKFNIHRRLRPEALGGRIDRFFNGFGNTEAFKPLRPLIKALQDLRWCNAEFLKVINDHNAGNNATHFPGESIAATSYLLPMAFPEGSPMHPSYGAGHATVAGACVTILKAFFDSGWNLPVACEPNKTGNGLTEVQLECPLTVEGELNKLASNISIGRNWAGVHYFTDYIESIRMGEQIAIQLLQEQKLTYSENFTMSVPLFDGGTIRI